MIEQEIGSWEAALAIREAEEVIKGKARGARRRLAARKVGRRLCRGLLAAGFLTLCFLPTIAVLVLVALALLLAR